MKVDKFREREKHKMPWKMRHATNTNNNTAILCVHGKQAETTTLRPIGQPSGKLKNMYVCMYVIITRKHQLSSRMCICVLRSTPNCGKSTEIKVECRQPTSQRRVSSANDKFFKCLPKCERVEVLHVPRFNKDKNAICADKVGMWETVKNAVATNKAARERENRQASSSRRSSGS